MTRRRHALRKYSGRATRFALPEINRIDIHGEFDAPGRLERFAHRAPQPLHIFNRNSRELKVKR